MSVSIGFLGTGFMGQIAHLANYVQIPECKVVSLAEVRSKLGRKVASYYHIPTVCNSHEELLADDSIDAVIASQPYHRNYYLGRQVLESGKHLFTEKPMAANLKDAKELVSLAKAKKLKYAVGFMKRYDPGIQLSQKVLANFNKNNELGSLKMVDTTCFLGDWLQNCAQPIATDEPPPADNLQPRYPDDLDSALQKQYDHFLNIYSHNVNLLHFLLPDSKIICESGYCKNNSFLITLSAGNVLISLRGTPGISNKWEEHTSFYFEKGRVEIQSAAPMNRQKVADVTVWRESGGSWTQQNLFAPVQWAFYKQAEAFVRAIDKDADLPTSGDKCLADAALMEDIFKKLKQETNI
jgi:predicted dehydrogenase